MNLAPQSLLVVGRPTSTAPTPENIFDRLLSLLRESGGASLAYNQVATNHTKMDYRISSLTRAGAGFHGRGLPSKMETDAPQY